MNPSQFSTLCRLFVNCAKLIAHAILASKPCHLKNHPEAGDAAHKLQMAENMECDKIERNLSDILLMELD